MEYLSTQANFDDDGIVRQAPKQRRLDFPLDFQEISPPLTEPTESTPNRPVRPQIVTQQSSTFSRGDTSQFLNHRPSKDSEHMWMTSPDTQHGLPFNDWRPQTPRTESGPTSNAMSLPYADYNFDFQYPQQGMLEPCELMSCD